LSVHYRDGGASSSNEFRTFKNATENEENYIIRVQTICNLKGYLKLLLTNNLPAIIVNYVSA